MNLRDNTYYLNPVLFLSLTHARVFAHVLSIQKMFAQDICFALLVNTWGVQPSPNLAKVLPSPSFTWHFYLGFGVASPGPHHYNAFLSTSVNTREGTTIMGTIKKTLSASSATYTLLEGRLPKLDN